MAVRGEDKAQMRPKNRSAPR